MLVGGVLCGSTVVISSPLAGAGLVGADFAGFGRNLLLVAVDCLTLPCSGPCSLRRPAIVPSCTGAALKSQ